MSNKRDTQFQGFAKALWLELFRLKAIDVRTYVTFGEKVEEIIARRAYDLVDHAMHNVELADLERCEYREELTHKIPDLNELPNEQASDR